MEHFDHKEIEKKIVEAKKKLIALSSDHKKNFINIEKHIAIEVEEIEQRVVNNKQIIPELDYHKLVSNAVDKNLVNLIKKRGCVIIRNVFDKKQIEFWNSELVKYIDNNILKRFGDDRWLFISAILGGGFWDSKPELRNKIIGEDIPKFSLHTGMNISMEEINDRIANNNIFGVNIPDVNRLTILKISIINHPNINQDILTKLREVDHRMLIANTYSIKRGLYKNKYNPNIPHSEDINIMAKKSGEELHDYYAKLDEILGMIEQSGGNYDYIKNPLTNRKVKINTILGKQIIKKYSDVINM